MLTREEFGHWEMDLVIGKQKEKSALLSLTERKTRMQILCYIKSRTSKAVVDALNEYEYKLGEDFSKIFKTITVDNGAEFSDVEGITKSVRMGKRTELFFCHPYAPHERGSNEVQHKLVRRFIPKKKPIEPFKNRIKEIELWINSYLRKLFDWRAAKDLFKEEITKLLGSVPHKVKLAFLA